MKFQILNIREAGQIELDVIDPNGIRSKINVKNIALELYFSSNDLRSHFNQMTEILKNQVIKKKSIVSRQLYEKNEKSIHKPYICIEFNYVNHLLGARDCLSRLGEVYYNYSGTLPLMIESFIYQTKLSIFHCFECNNASRLVDVNDLKRDVSNEKTSFMKMYVAKTDTGYTCMLSHQHNNKINFSSINEVNQHIKSVKPHIIIHDEHVVIPNFLLQINVSKIMHSRYDKLDHLCLKDLASEMFFKGKVFDLIDVLLYCDVTFELTEHFVHETIESKWVGLGCNAVFSLNFLSLMYGRCIVPSMNTPIIRNLKGGLVLGVVPCFYNERGCIFDFKAFYPSIVIQNNMCKTTMNGDKFLDAKERVGLLPLLLRDLFAKREHARNEGKKPREMVLKKIINSILGCLSNKTCMFYCPELYSAMTLHGRANLTLAKEIISKRAIVVAGDTDSIMTIIESGLLKTSTEILDELNSIFPGVIKLGIDSMSSSSIYISKKVRIEVDYFTGEIKNKGFITRAMNQFTSGLLMKMLKMIMIDNASIKSVKSFVVAELERLWTYENTEELVHVEKLSKDHYDKQSHINMIINQDRDIYNKRDVIEYFYTNGKIEYSSVNLIGRRPNVYVLNMDKYYNETRRHILTLLRAIGEESL